MEEDKSSFLCPHSSSSSTDSSKCNSSAASSNKVHTLSAAYTDFMQMPLFMDSLPPDFQNNVGLQAIAALLEQDRLESLSATDHKLSVSLPPSPPQRKTTHSSRLRSHRANIANPYARLSRPRRRSVSQRKAVKFSVHPPTQTVQTDSSDSCATLPDRTFTPPCRSSSIARTDSELSNAGVWHAAPTQPEVPSASVSEIDLFLKLWRI